MANGVNLNKYNNFNMENQYNKLNNENNEFQLVPSNPCLTTIKHKSIEQLLDILSNSNNKIKAKNQIDPMYKQKPNSSKSCSKIWKKCDLSLGLNRDGILTITKVSDGKSFEKESLLNFGREVTDKIEEVMDSYKSSATKYTSNDEMISNIIESPTSLCKDFIITETANTEVVIIDKVNDVVINSVDKSSKSELQEIDVTKKRLSAVDKLRQSYLAKLDLNNVNSNKNKKESITHNSLIIFDWDDTLLPTSYLQHSGIIINEAEELNESVMSKLNQLDQTVFQILTQAIKLGDTYIITNSEPGWVEYSCKRFYPKSLQLLSSLKIVSARGEFEKSFPGDNKQWKIQAFLNTLKTVNVNLVTNLICLGDSTIEMEAAHVLASKFSQAFIKTIKFKEIPRPNELNKQLKTVDTQFSKIYDSVKNLTIRVEKKQ